MTPKESRGKRKHTDEVHRKSAARGVTDEIKDL